MARLLRHREHLLCLHLCLHHHRGLSSRSSKVCVTRTRVSLPLPQMGRTQTVFSIVQSGPQQAPSRAGASALAEGAHRRRWLQENSVDLTSGPRGLPPPVRSAASNDAPPIAASTDEDHLFPEASISMSGARRTMRALDAVELHAQHVHSAQNLGDPCAPSPPSANVHRPARSASSCSRARGQSAIERSAIKRHQMQNIIFSACSL